MATTGDARVWPAIDPKVGAVPNATGAPTTTVEVADVAAAEVADAAAADLVAVAKPAVATSPATSNPASAEWVGRRKRKDLR
jgi:hypothetical protein